MTGHSDPQFYTWPRSPYALFSPWRRRDVPEPEPGSRPAACARRTVITSFGAEVIDHSADDDPEEQDA